TATRTVRDRVCSLNCVALAAWTALDVQLDNIAVVQDVIAGDGLTGIGALTPEPGGFEAVGEVAGDDGGELDQRAAGGAGERRRHVGLLAWLLRIYSDDVQELVDGFAQLGQAGARLGGSSVDGEALAEQVADDRQTIFGAGRIELIGEKKRLGVVDRRVFR